MQWSLKNYFSYYVNNGLIGKRKFIGNRPFPHSNKQWRRIGVGLDKNAANEWKCPPQTRSGVIVRKHWSGMRERSIPWYAREIHIFDAVFFCPCAPYPNFIFRFLNRRSIQFELSTTSRQVCWSPFTNANEALKGYSGVWLGIELYVSPFHANNSWSHETETPAWHWMDAPSSNRLI